MLPLRRLAPLTLVPLLLPALSSAQIVKRFSTDSQTAQANHDSRTPKISADGSLVVFTSRASNLVGGDTNGVDDVFVKDVATAAVTLVSVGLGGVSANGASRAPVVSASLRYVAFESDATNLVAGDTNGETDIFLRDLWSSTTELISTGIGGPGDHYSIQPSISGTGFFIAFASKATNLVSGDTNARIDIFVRNISTQTTVRLTPGSLQSNADSVHPQLSGNGLKLAFESSASNIVANDLNGFSDVFVADLTTGQVAAASMGPSGTANGASRNPSLSSTGVILEFESDATNIAGADNNGVTDIYGYNTVSQSPFRTSIGPGDVEPNGRCYAPSASGIGSHAAYCSDATNLAPGDINGASDVFYCHIGDPGGSIELVSRGATVLCANGASRAPSLDNYGGIIAFESDASNLISGDTNSRADAYVRWRITPVTFYCTSSITTHGCSPYMAADGVASVSSAAAPFTIAAVQVEAQRSGIIFYSLNPTATPWGTGGTSYLCVHAPSQRTGVHNTGGTLGTCEGVLSLDFLHVDGDPPERARSPVLDRREHPRAGLVPRSGRAEEHQHVERDQVHARLVSGAAAAAGHFDFEREIACCSTTCNATSRSRLPAAVRARSCSATACGAVPAASSASTPGCSRSTSARRSRRACSRSEFVRVSHRRTVPSPELDASCEPSGLHASEYT